MAKPAPTYKQQSHATPPIVKFPKLHPTQQIIHDDPARFKIIACGRRFGKTRLCEIIAAETALNRGLVWWINPSYKQTFNAWTAINKMCDPIIIKRREMEKYVEFIGGGQIFFHTAGTDEDLRGAGLNLAILDEGAYLNDNFFPSVISPMLSDKKGKLLVPSTPNGINWFYDAYGTGTDPAFPDWKSWQFTSYDNPYIDPAEIDRQKLITPDLIFRQEYLAEFIDMSGAVFKNIGNICVLQPALDPIQHHIYVAGVDWGGSKDFSVISVIDATKREMVYYERIRETDFEAQYAMITGVCRRYNVRQVIAEENAIGKAPTQALQRTGLFVLPFTTSQNSKHALVQEFMFALESGGIKLLDDPILKGEMAAYTSKKSVNGLYSYAASRGHDDVIMATMLAYHLIGAPPTIASEIRQPVRKVPITMRPKSLGFALGGGRKIDSPSKYWGRVLNG